MEQDLWKAFVWTWIALGSWGITSQMQLELCRPRMQTASKMIIANWRLKFWDGGNHVFLDEVVKEYVIYHFPHISFFNDRKIVILRKKLVSALFVRIETMIIKSKSKEIISPICIFWFRLRTWLQAIAFHHISFANKSILVSKQLYYTLPVHPCVCNGSRQISSLELSLVKKLSTKHKNFHEHKNFVFGRILKATHICYWPTTAWRWARGYLPKRIL